MSGRRDRGSTSAGSLETWVARAWNVFNEGRPFSVVYPPMALAGAAIVGVGLGGSTGWGLLAGLALSAVWTCFSFPLRSRALLWALLCAGVVVLQSGRALGLLAVGLGGYAFFTVVLWGGIYYRLRTGAPRMNPLRFWRLVATNSDPTSGNALEQIPKTVLTLSAMALVAQEPTAQSVARVALVAGAAAILGALAWRRFAETRLPRYPERGAPAGMADRPAAALARRVYVIVIDGCNRDRLRQASALGRTPALDRLFAGGTEYLDVRTAYPARTVVCFSSMLTGATPAEHGMRSNFAPRLGVRAESLFEVLERHGRRGRMVGIAHLLDPFPPAGDQERVRTVSSVQPTSRIDFSLMAAAREVLQRDDPDLLVLQLLAADQIGHVRGTRNPEYIDQLAETDRHVGDLVAWLGERGRLQDATIIVMADHGQGRGIGGHGHLDWGETPVPFCIHGAGSVPGAVVERPSSVLELARTLATLLGLPAPERSRGRPLVPVLDPDVRPGRPASSSPDGARALAVVPVRDEAQSIAAVLAALPDAVDGVELDVLVVDDGSVDGSGELARAAGARVLRHQRSRGLGAAVRAGLELARDEGYAACLYIDGDGEYDAAQAARLLSPVLTGRGHYVLGSRFLGHRTGMTWHRCMANRALSSIMGALLGGRVLTDAQTGCRAFSAHALRHAHIAHDYNYAQVLTLALWGQGIEPLEVPIDYRRRDTGASFVRYPEYVRRVAPAVWRQWRHSRAARRRSPARTTARTAFAHADPVANSGSAASSGPSGARDEGPTSPPPSIRSSA